MINELIKALASFEAGKWGLLVMTTLAFMFLLWHGWPGRFTGFKDSSLFTSLRADNGFVRISRADFDPGTFQANRFKAHVIRRGARAERSGRRTVEISLINVSKLGLEALRVLKEIADESDANPGDYLFLFTRDQMRGECESDEMRELVSHCRLMSGERVNLRIGTVEKRTWKTGAQSS